MKDKISSCFLLSLRILASAWLSFLVSMIPLYIWRATHPNDKVGENLIMAIIGLFFGFIFLMILQMRDDRAHRCSLRDTLLISGGGVGIYMLLWIIVYPPAKNNYLIAALGYHLSCLIGTGEDSRPTFLASLASAFIFGVIYFSATIVGTKTAQTRQKRFLKDLKGNK